MCYCANGHPLPLGDLFYFEFFEKDCWGSRGNLDLSFAGLWWWEALALLCRDPSDVINWIRIRRGNGGGVLDTWILDMWVEKQSYIQGQISV